MQKEALIAAMGADFTGVMRVQVRHEKKFTKCFTFNFLELLDVI